MHNARIWVVAGVCFAAACDTGPKTVEPGDFGTREVTMPNGKKVRAETVFRVEDMAKGLMFRDSLAPDRGMLFLHDRPGNYSYFMYQTRIPLDIIWMDKDRRIVEISADTPPCPSKSASQCPHFGGKEAALFVLEIAGGMASKFGLKVGDRIDF